MFGFVFGLLGAAAFGCAGLIHSANKSISDAEYNDYLDKKESFKTMYTLHAQAAEYEIFTRCPVSELANMKIYHENMRYIFGENYHNHLGTINVQDSTSYTIYLASVFGKLTVYDMSMGVRTYGEPKDWRFAEVIENNLRAAGTNVTIGFKRNSSSGNSGKFHIMELQNRYSGNVMPIMNIHAPLGDPAKSEIMFDAFVKRRLCGQSPDIVERTCRFIYENNSEKYRQVMADLHIDL